MITELSIDIITAYVKEHDPPRGREQEFDLGQGALKERFQIKMTGAFVMEHEDPDDDKNGNDRITGSGIHNLGYGGCPLN